MAEDYIERLRTSVRQAGEHARGERDLEHIRFVDEPDPREIRERFDLTQEEFAEALEISIGTLQNWEQGRRTPSSPAKAALRLLSVIGSPAPRGEGAATSTAQADPDSREGEVRNDITNASILVEHVEGGMSIVPPENWMPLRDTVEASNEVQEV